MDQNLLTITYDEDVSYRMSGGGLNGEKNQDNFVTKRASPKLYGKIYT